MLRKLVIGLILLLTVYLIYHHKSVKYGLEQAYGQLQLLSKAVPLDDYLATSPPDSLIEKINLIQSVKKYAEDSLSLKVTNSYQSIYDQKGKAILWMVTASPEFELQAYEWTFPIAGSFEYKGFFDLQKAKEEIKSLEAEGYETDLDEVSAWSTLGFFNDPILSSMLERDSGRLADLIIHELCHASIFLKDSIELNENLASFIGRKGAESYLMFIKDSSELQRMRSNRLRRQIWQELIHEGAIKLDSLYSNFTAETSLSEKRVMKQKVIDGIRWKVAVNLYDDSLKIKEQYERFKPNNAFFTGYLTYRARSNYFENELDVKFNGNLRAFIEYYISEYGK